VLTALLLDHPPELGDPLGVGQLPAPQRGQGLGGVGAAHVDLAGKRGRLQVLAVADLAGPPCLFDPLQRAGGRLAWRLDLGPAAAGVGGLQRRELVGGWLAVAGRLGPQRGQARVAGAGGPQGVQPLPGGRHGGAELAGELGRVQRCAAAQLAGQVGVADPVADQPPAQLGKARVTLALGAQHPHQVAGQPWGDADLGRQRGRVDLVAGVDKGRGAHTPGGAPGAGLGSPQGTIDRADRARHHLRPVERDRGGMPIGW
jgi:hypothetical protein